MGLEKRCGDEEDMHVSTASIPILRAEQVGIVDENSPAETQVIRRLEERLENPTVFQWPPVVYAPLGDPEFWLEFHHAIIGKAIRQLQEGDTARQLAEARIPLIQNDLYRQFTDKVRFANELAAQKEVNESDRIEYAHQTALLIAKYFNLVYILGIVQDQHETEIQELEKLQDLRLQFYRLAASNEIERKEDVIKMYEERFGTREELERLAQAEENTKLPGALGPRKYVDISALIKQHETGERPKTVGQRMADFAEKLLNPDTYHHIAQAVYRAFRKEERPKEPPIKIDDCG